MWEVSGEVIKGRKGINKHDEIIEYIIWRESMDQNGQKELE